MFHEADRYFQAADFPHDRASLNRNMARFYLNSSSDKDRINVGLAHVKIAEDFATRRFVVMTERFHKDLKQIKGRLQSPHCKSDHLQNAPRSSIERAAVTCIERTWKIAVMLIETTCKVAVTLIETTCKAAVTGIERAWKAAVTWIETTWKVAVMWVERTWKGVD